MVQKPNLDQWKALAAKQLKGQSPDTWIGTPRRHSGKTPLHRRRSGKNGTSGRPARLCALCARAHGHHVRRTALDHPPVCRFSTAKESNAFYRRNLAAGQKGLSVAFDLATHRGYDSDHPRVVGRCGQGRRGHRFGGGHEDPVRSDPLERDVGFHDHERRRAAHSGHVHRGRRRAGRAQEQLTGTIQNDILKEYLTRNTYIYPPVPSMRIVADIIAHCSANMPRSTRSASAAIT
jgi:methylmalonyl-CoA mutase